MADKVCVFWDNSNVYIGGQEVAVEKEGPLAAPQLRINFRNLFDLAVAGRNVEYAACVGSVPPDLSRIWDQLEDATGIKVELYERGSMSGKEQGVDQCLQVHMLRVCVDISPPGIAVLVTGDGRGYDEGRGFYADLERMYKKGWGVEVLSWDAACDGRLRTWVSTVGAYVKLDDFYDYVTYRETGRPSVKVTKRRNYARPR